MGKRWLLIELYLLQLFLTVFLVYSFLNNTYEDKRIPMMSFFFIIIIVMLLSFWVVQQILQLADKEIEGEKIKARLGDANNLVVAMKLKHHDFLNHLQVLSAFVQMRRYGDADIYIRRLSHDLRQIDQIVALQRPDVAALINQKLVTGMGIKTDLVINTTLAGLATPPEKLIGILGNLVDNALYEIKAHDYKWLSIKINEENGWFVFEIKNPGTIPIPIQQLIFESGFSTKGQKGSGMGLYIVKNLVKECGGTLSFTSSEKDGTTFLVKLPSDNLEKNFPVVTSASAKPSGSTHPFKLIS